MSNEFPASFLNYLHSIDAELADKVHNIARGALERDQLRRAEIDAFFVIKRKFDARTGTY